MKSTQEEFITQTQDFWEPRLGYRPTEGQAETMIRNVTNLFKLLMEWDMEEQEKADGSSLSSETLIQNSSAGGLS